VVCCDERPSQLVREVRQPVLAAPGQPGRYDDDYRREGTCHLCMCLQPLGGWRHVKVTDRRTAQDFAHGMRDLVDSHFPQAPLISVGLDHLNTHTPAALEESFAPAEARRRLQNLDFRATPKHGSGLNLAEIECAVLSTPCLNRRIPEQATRRRRVEAWNAGRNAAAATINWRFTTAKARRTLKRLYPSSSVWSTTKYTHESYAAWAPMIDSTRCGPWLYRSKNAYAALSRASRETKSSHWVTSRRNCRHSISIGFNQGL
jgi:hypothetical protein